MLLVGLCVVTLLSGASCSGPTRVREAPRTIAEPEPEPEPVPEVEPEPTVREDLAAPDGTACAHSDECGAGQLCRGPRGCTTPWACGAPPEDCSGERIAYCDCDGATFYAISGCPGRSYAHVGACDAMGPLAAADELGLHDYDEPPTTEDRTCTSSAECRRGEQCFGPPGCGMEWRCERVRGCGRETVELCGCDGASFRASARCPGRPYLRRGSCDVAVARADETEPTSPDAAVAVARLGLDAGTPARTSVTSSAVAVASVAPDAGVPASLGVGPGERVCSTSRDCRRGELCIGPPGCGMAWVCARPTERCNPDTQVFCDCERNTFRASMNCPGQPFAHRGSCEIDRMLELSGASAR